MSENQNIIGGYELRNCVATGATTQIWEVAQQGSTIPLAMKLLLPDALKDPETKTVLKHEFKVGSNLEHPNFVRFHKIELTRDHGFFIMDYFRAPSLKSQLSANLPETQSKLKKIVEAVCQAFCHMNEKGWLHRDVKPDNILVNKTGEVRVIDFSLATRVISGVMKLVSGKQKNIMGTRTYIAPEIVLRQVPTIQSDIYSLAVTIYEVATGAPPFAGLNPNDLLKKHLSETPAPPSAVNPNVTPDLDAVILKMLAKKPKDRPADMREVMSIFRNARCFTEDPLELHEKKIKEAKEKESLSVDKRLDSRADADRVARGIAAPAKTKKSKRLTAPIGEIEAPKKAGSHPQQSAQPQQPIMIPQMPFPGMMMPQMPNPMMPPMPPQLMQPGMSGQPWMPNLQMPPQMYPPQMYPPQMYPPQMYPPQMYPGMSQIPGGALAAGQQSPVGPDQQSGQGPTAQDNPKANESSEPPAELNRNVILPSERREAMSATPEEIHDLDFMTELPDIE